MFMSKEQVNKLVLNMGCIIKWLKLDEQLLEKQKRLQKTKKNQYLNLKVSRHNQRSILSLKKTGFKKITGKEKSVFTTWCFNDIFLVKNNEIIFHVPIGSAKKIYLIDFHHNALVIKYVQHEENNCVFSSLTRALYDAREHAAEKAIFYWLE